MSAAQAGNSVVCDILTGAGQALGRGVAMLVNIFNPQLVIFSGEGVRAGELLLGPMREALYANAMPALSETVKLHTEPLGDDAWARGAASLVLQELFRTAQPDLERIGSR